MSGGIIIIDWILNQRMNSTVVVVVAFLLVFSSARPALFRTKTIFFLSAAKFANLVSKNAEIGDIRRETTDRRH